MTRIANHVVARAVRRTLALSAVAATTVASMPAHAQEPGEEATVVVTGSRIQRQDYESASPIVTVGEDAFKQTGSTTVETLLNTLPQFVPSVTNTSNNPSNGGQANIELRGLDTSRTLVLLDGKRVVPANGTGVVDLNMLPASLISNVEIISGGASAVYGSDAIAGVVNIKTRDFEGLQFDTNYGETSESDGEEWQASVTAGTRFADGRGKVVANFAYSDRSSVRAGDRPWSRVALGYFGPDTGFLPLGSGTIEEGSVSVAASQAAIDAVFAGYGVAPGTVKNTTFGFNNDGTIFSTGDGSTSGSVANFRGTIDDTFNDAAFSYNFSPPNYLQLPLERKTGFLRGSFEVTPAAEVYAQGIWAEYDANTQLAPSPASQLFIPITNPYIPDDLAALIASRVDDPDTPINEATQPLSMGKRLSELGPRFENNHYNVYQIMAGVKGNLSDSWAYDVYASHGKVEVDNTQLGSVSRTRFEELAFAADGGESICGGMNPFGLGSISAECAEYMTVDAVNRINVEQNVAEASVTGPVFAMPAGDLQAAFGIFYKEDKYSFIADDKLRAQTTGAFGLPIRADVSGFNASDNTVGKTDSTELYVETLVPLLKDMPAIRKLDLTLGYRYADYSTAGGVNSYKAELTYEPDQPVLLRGSYQRAVRAPNITELFQPQLTNFPSFNPPDPCNATSPQRNGPNGSAVRDLCLAQGLPSSLINSFAYSNQQVEGLQGGNPDLQEETADTLTFGLVFRSPWEGLMENFQASIDWYQIEIEDAIDAVSAATFIDRCYDPAFNPTFDVNNFYCSFFTRNTVNGEITAAAETQQNLAAIKTSGVDLQFDWAFDVGPGRLAVNWVGSWLDKWDQQELPGDSFTQYAGTIRGTIGTAFPKWKWTMNLNYAIAGVGLNARWRYVDNMTDQSETEFKLPSISYFDVAASYGFQSGMLDGVTLRAGVTNLTDKLPLIYPSYVQSNTDPSTYDVLGRRYFMAVTYTFK